MKYKYKKQIATSALAISLLIGGSSVFAATPQDLGIKNIHQTYQKQNKNNKNLGARKRVRNNTVGTVSAMNDAEFTVEVKNAKTKNMSSVDVKTGVSTIYSKNGIEATISDLSVGQKVIVVGDFDKTANVITAKKVKIA